MKKWIKKTCRFFIDNSSPVFYISMFLIAMHFEPKKTLLILGGAAALLVFWGMASYFITVGYWRGTYSGLKSIGTQEDKKS